MELDNYKFVLKTCASSENEVTGEDIEHKDEIVLETLFQYSSYSSKFKILYAEPKHCESIWFGRYNYSYELTLEKR